MINLSFNDFATIVNYPAVNKQSDSGFEAAKIEAQRNYLLPIIGRDLLPIIEEFSQLEVLQWATGTTSVVDIIYSYRGKYYKCLVSTTDAPTAGTNFAISQMGFLYKELVEPFMCYSIYYLLLLRSGVTLKGNNALTSNISYEQKADTSDLQRNLNHYQDFRGNLERGITEQLSSWSWKIDGVQYEQVSNFCNLAPYNEAKCLDFCETGTVLNRNPIIRGTNFAII
jgi:hypothetical protein